MTAVEERDEFHRPNYAYPIEVVRVRALSRLLDPFERRLAALQGLESGQDEDTLWLQQVDDEGGYLTSFLDDSPFINRDVNAGYWRQYRRVVPSAALDPDNPEESDEAED